MGMREGVCEHVAVMKEGEEMTKEWSLRRGRERGKGEETWRWRDGEVEQEGAGRRRRERLNAGGEKMEGGGNIKLERSKNGVGEEGKTVRWKGELR